MQQDSGPITMVTPGYEQPPQVQHQETAVTMATGQQMGPAEGQQQYGQDQANFEADKRAVYKHPLFPLLALLFEKCEMATQSAECPSSENFNMDIQAFVEHQDRDRKPLLMEDPEVDALMIKAIQVLRIHLLELEKVQELCKDFCNRYITCLKGKMQSENLLRSDYGYDSDSSNSTTSQNNYNSQSQPPQNVQVVSTAGQVLVQQPTQIAYQMVQTPQGLVAQPIQIQGAPNVTVQPPASVQQPGNIIHGSTPLASIGANPCPPPQENSLLQTPPTPGSLDDEDDLLGKKKQKRGVLPKHATSIMRSWLFQHIVHPYPTEDEKRQIAAQTNLTLLQVNNWFINARRRILQPMLDASNPDSSHKAKKAKTQSSRPAAQRFWPDNIANLQPQLADSSVISSTMLSSDESEDSNDEGEVSIPLCLEQSDNSQQ